MNKLKPEMFMLVNLGPQIPKHLMENISWLTLNFPDTSILVVFDDESHKGRFINRNIEEYLYQRKEDVKDLLPKLGHDTTFRGGFWHLTIDRLFALCDAVIELSLERAIYVESDVLLLPNFPINKVGRLDKLSWTRYNHLRDVPSIVVIPNANLAKQMRSELVTRFENDIKLTDMSVLNQLASDRKELVSLLPTIVKGLENQKLVNRDELERITDLLPLFASRFKGIFDGATIGMYLTGQDPRNSYGFTTFLNSELLDVSESYVDLKVAEFRYKERRLYLLTQEGEKIEIFNLHIHSKDPAMFTEQVFRRLKIMVDKAEKRVPYTQFNYKILSSLIIENMRNRTLLRYFRKFLFYSLKRLESRFKSYSS